MHASGITLNPPTASRLSERLLEIAADTSRTHISIGQLLSELDDRAIAALLLIFALPNAIPMPPGTSSLLGAPLIFLTAQLMLALSPWLPRFIAQRSLAQPTFASVVARTAALARTSCRSDPAQIGRAHV